MKLYNTLTRKIEEVKPLDSKTIRIYSCGPTVYDHAHIGNLSSFIYADTLRRIIKASGFNVHHVMNFTDVDDKTIKRSHEENPTIDPKQSLGELTDRYSGVFLDDMRAIGNDVDALEFKKATDHITQMQEMVRKLLEAGMAYTADDGVYFSISAYRQKGKKYGQLLKLTEASTSEARIQNDEYDKESVHDFALWKKQKDGEPAWGFEIDGQRLDGRPGWHIECSAMSEAALGLPFDIHTGGVDLIFPHHENEIAQSTAANGQDLMAKIFFHNEHVLVDGKKMSKSLGNFITLKDIEAKGFDPMAFRLLVLQSHYRSQSNFTWEILESAQNRLNELRAWADLLYQPSTDIMPQELDEMFRDTRQNILRAMQSDLNTPEALAALGALVSYMQNFPIPGVEGKYTDGTLAFLDDMFGLDLANRPDISEDQKQLIQEREAARKAKNWAKSDEIRDQLKEQGIELRDTPQGPIWNRV